MLRVVSNQDMIFRHFGHMEIETNKSCEGTTPDNSVFLFEDGTVLKAYAYCSFVLGADLDFGKLEPFFCPATIEHTDTLYGEAYAMKKAQLEKSDNSYLSNITHVMNSQSQPAVVLGFYKW